MRSLFGIIVFSFISATLLGQYQQINGVVNSYYPVENVTAAYVEMPAGTDLSGLVKGDKVVLMEMTGADYNVADPVTERIDYTGWGDAGRYVLLSVASVDDTVDRVYFTAAINATDFTPGEKIQLIKIFEADFAEVTSTLTVPDWNGTTGGVLAMVIFKKLILSANIDVNNKGFRGAEPVPDYPGICRDFIWSVDSLYFLPSQLHRAGRIGEGNGTVDFPYTMGPGRFTNAGGGGFGYFAGGGGGSHWGSGGYGGYQQASCPLGVNAFGGAVMQISNGNFYNQDRVSMGGGGGASVEDGSHSATKGGDGGGIVIIMADTIQGNGHSILANGEAVTVDATAGAGGGGAGGAVLLDINEYENNLSIFLRGGKGGDTGAETTGAGGGGGGGIFWYAGSGFPPNVSASVTSGSGGESADINLSGTVGSNGVSEDSLYLPLNGFLFNSLGGVDTLCQGQTPNLITASMPKGGTSGYTYTWLQSLDSTSWSVIGGATDSLFYQPPALTQTTFYTRVVESGGIRDTALTIKILVYDAIAGNNLNIRDTLCYNDSPAPLSTAPLTGGNGIYQYLWQSRTESGNWQNRALSASLNEGALQESMLYRRIATSGKVCVDTTNVDTLSVLESIAGNTLLRTDSAICNGLDAGTLLANNVTGGDGAYSYYWYASDDDVTYNLIPGAISPSYSPGTLTEDIYYYQREVRSGSDDACIDRSETYTMTVYPSISNNIVSTDETLYCYNVQPNDILGGAAGGGDGSSYDYTWQWRAPGDAWSDIAGENGQNYSPSTNYTDTTEVRRVVVSGNYDACINNSNVLRLDVIPEIVNTLISPDESICEGSTPLAFNEEAATGGTGTIGYLWEYQPAAGGEWFSALELPNDQEDYVSGALTVSTLFRRNAISSICTTASNIIEITVFPAITNNVIEGGTLQYTCFNDPIILEGIAGLAGGQPGDLRFSWEESVEDVSWNPASGTTNQASYESPPLTDTVYYRRIVISGNEDQCMDTTEAVLVRINTLPSGDIISDAYTACVDDPVPVAFENLSGNGPWSIGLGVGETTYTEEDINSASGTIDFPAVQTGDLVVQDITDVNGCHADLSGNTGVIDLTVYEWPIAFAGDDAEVCGQEFTLEATQTGEAGIWTGPGDFTDPSDPNTLVSIETFSESITHTFQWKEWNWECADSTEVVLIFYEPPEQPVLPVVPPLDYTFEYQLDAPEHVGNGIWTMLSGPAGGTAEFEDPAINNTMVYFTDLLYGDYLLQWSVVNGSCPEVSESTLISIGDIQSFTAFSPNGDGINDEYIINVSSTASFILYVYDRWGNIVAQIDNTENREQIVWKGTFNNDRDPELPEGTYFYVLTQNGEKYKWGYIELRR